MFVYQFMSAPHALQNIRHRRLKVSFLSDMNDPFELLGASLPLPAHRRALRQWKDYMNGICSVLCFSRGWQNPVMWSHYADKHRGVCLSFEVPDTHLLPISYATTRLEGELERDLAATGTVSEDLSRRLLTTKFADWKYENEVRMFVKPAELHAERGLHFYPFGAALGLRRVILGPRSTATIASFEKAIHPQDRPVIVIESRLAFKSFRVLPSPKASRGSAARDA